MVEIWYRLEKFYRSFFWVIKGKKKIFSNFPTFTNLPFPCQFWKLKCTPVQVTCWDLTRFLTNMVILKLFFYQILWEIINSKLPLFCSDIIKLESFTTSKMDCHLLRQKVCQKISVIITNICVFVVSNKYISYIGRIFGKQCFLSE